MPLIDADKIKQLASAFDQEMVLQAHFQKFQVEYHHNFCYNLPHIVLQQVDKVNRNLIKGRALKHAEISPKNAQTFRFGELKIFKWVLTVYCYQRLFSLQELLQHHFHDIQSIFCNKSPQFLRYEALCLAFEKTKYPSDWSAQELDILRDVVSERGTYEEWRNISYELYCRSNDKYYRPFQQCRQKWFNHLDPRINKGTWTIEEDITLLSAIEAIGTKWAQISREMGSIRTEHMVKNRYNSLMNYWKKKYEKTNPKKIVIKVLKHLKKKLKEGDTDNSLCQDEAQSCQPSKNTASKPIEDQQQEAILEIEQLEQPPLKVHPSAMANQVLENAFPNDEIKIQPSNAITSWNTSFSVRDEDSIDYRFETSRRCYLLEHRLGGKAERRTWDEDDGLEQLSQFNGIASGANGFEAAFEGGNNYMFMEIESQEVPKKMGLSCRDYFEDLLELS